MGRTGRRFVTRITAGLRAVAEMCRVPVFVNLATLATFVTGTVGLPVGEYGDCQTEPTVRRCAAARHGRTSTAVTEDAIRPSAGGCRCAGDARATGSCCCTGKGVAKAKRTCCAKSEPRLAADQRATDDSLPRWTSCPCGPASTLVLFVSGDPRQLPAVVELAHHDMECRSRPMTRLLTPQAIVAPEPRPPRVAAC